MSFSLFDQIIAASRKAGIVRFGTATGGSSVTIVDSGLSQNTADGDYVGATLFIIGGGSTSINGQFRKVTAYSAGTGTFTFSSLATTAGADVGYAYTTPEFSYELLIELANDGLRSIGDLDWADKDTITSSAAQTDYSYEVAWKRAAPTRIDLQTAVGSSATRNDWEEMRDWEYVPSSGGATGLVIFNGVVPAGRKIRIWYRDTHPRITGSTSPIDERIAPDLAVAAMVEKMYGYRNSLNRGSVPFDVERWTEAKREFQEAKLLYPLWKPERKRRLLILRKEADHLPWPPPYGPS